MPDTKHWIGRKVKIYFGEIIKEGKTHKSYVLDDKEFEKEVRSQFLSVRFVLPGYGVTTDSDMRRLNVHINEKGIVTQVRFG